MLKKIQKIFDSTNSTTTMLNELYKLDPNATVKPNVLDIFITVRNVTYIAKAAEDFDYYPITII